MVNFMNSPLIILLVETIDEKRTRLSKQILNRLKLEQAKQKDKDEDYFLPQVHRDEKYDEITNRLHQRLLKTKNLVFQEIT